MEMNDYLEAFELHSAQSRHPLRVRDAAVAFRIAVIRCVSGTR